MEALWTLHGSGVLLLRDWKSARALVHYDDSPVGAYDEFAIIEMTFRGPRVTQILVTSQESKTAGRALWGFPKEVENLKWNRIGRAISFRAGKEEFFLRAGRFGFPIHARGFCVQTLHEANVRVPVEIAGQMRLARRGAQLGFLLENFEMKFFPAQPITKR